MQISFLEDVSEMTDDAPALYEHKGNSTDVVPRDTM